MIFMDSCNFNSCSDVLIYVTLGCFVLTQAKVLCHNTRKFKEELVNGDS